MTSTWRCVVRAFDGAPILVNFARVEDITADTDVPGVLCLTTTSGSIRRIKGTMNDINAVLFGFTAGTPVYD